MFVKFEVAKARYAICSTCEHFATTLKMCRQCGCIMPMKVPLAAAVCPQGKWTEAESDPKTTSYAYKE